MCSFLNNTNTTSQSLAAINDEAVTDRLISKLNSPAAKKILEKMRELLEASPTNVDAAIKIAADSNLADKTKVALMQIASKLSVSALATEAARQADEKAAEEAAKEKVDRDRKRIEALARAEAINAQSSNQKQVTFHISC